MRKIGLKLWNINTDYYYKAAQELFKKNIYDYIELYIVPGNLDKLEIWTKLPIPFDIHGTHSAFNMDLSKVDHLEYNYACYLEAKTYADKLNANIIVFHGGINGDYHETARQLSLLKEKRALIENKPLYGIGRPDNEPCVGATFEEIKYIMEISNCGFCLDVGHGICSANAQGLEPYGYIEKLSTLGPSRIHLSDLFTDRLRDQHLNYGRGNLDFKRILDILPKDVPITIETNKASKFDLIDFENDGKFLRKLLS